MYFCTLAKKHMGDNYKMVAKTLHGFEDLLEEELKKLGAMDIRKVHGT